MIESPGMRWLSAAVLALAIPLWGSDAFATGVPAPSAAGLDRITSFFDNEVAAGRIPGAVVLIRQHGEPVYLKCFGLRDVATKRAMTPDTLFALHSMTKPITSVAAMMLVDRGRMSLDEPVAKYIPSFAAVQVGIETKDKNELSTYLQVWPAAGMVWKMRMTVDSKEYDDAKARILAVADALVDLSQGAQP